MKISELLQSAGFAVPPCTEDKNVSGVTDDSRRVCTGSVFVAIEGLHENGAVYAAAAVAAGAVLVVCEHPIGGVSVLTVPNARAAFSRLAAAFYGHPEKKMTFIGITGTNGKTTTAAMLAHILRAAGRHVGLVGTVGNSVDGEPLAAPNGNALANMTTPDPGELFYLFAMMRARGADTVVMEVTSHALALSKVEPLFFACAVFTNLTQDHLDFHGDMERYFREKCKLFDRCDKAVISLSSAYGARLAAMHPGALTLGEHNLKNVCSTADGVRFTLLQAAAPLTVEIPIPGTFIVENGALASLAALSLGVPCGAVKNALAAFPGVPGRMERVARNPLDIRIFIDYAHTPDALEKLLLSARAFRKKGERILLLFGCGGDRDRGKRSEMGRIGSRLADFLILTSDNCRSEKPAAILSDILKGVDKERPYKVIEDRAEAIAFAISAAISAARPGDIVLLAGKGHETYEIRGDRRLPFCERELVEAAVEKRLREEGYAR